METPLIDGTHFVYLMAIVFSALLIGWMWVFYIIYKTGESFREAIAVDAFLQNLTVIGVVVTTGCLTIAGVLNGDLAATLLSGVAGYVLGSMKGQKTTKGSPADRRQE